jgi:radical SAM superfamily enzyme YgiQ (UPF0313 family)
MKIKIISPAKQPKWGESFFDYRSVCKQLGRKAGGAPLVLPVLAALTPSDVEVVLIDENVEPINFDEKVDLVGITGMTYLISRSYEIADEYRKRGVPVVMGGIHVSALPEEAIQHSDSVVIGEAEEIWEYIMRDAQKGNLQKFYRAPRFPDLNNSPVPRWDLLKNNKYLYFSMQIGRGCPYNCEFCTVTLFNGREYRHKPVEKVMEEIDVLQKIDKRKGVFFADDNILSNSSYVKHIFGQLINKKVEWWCQASINRLKEDEMLKLMYDAGCRSVFVGFESILGESLVSMQKNQINKVEEYAETIKKVHSHGMGVFGSFVLGSDGEDETVFKKTEEFIMENNLLFAMVNILTPVIGTVLTERLEKEERLLAVNWDRHNGDFVCFKPQLMSPQLLQRKREELVSSIYSYNKIYKRFNGLCKDGLFDGEKRNALFAKVIGTFVALFFSKMSFNRFVFLLKCLWNPKNTSVIASMLPTLVCLNLHDYASKSAQKKTVYCD